MLTAKELLDKEFLETRCMLVEIAATMDRYERAQQAAQDDPDLDEADERLQQIYAALDVLASPQTNPNRSEQILMLFSDP